MYEIFKYFFYIIFINPLVTLSNRNQSTHQFRGFTLIEIMIAISISSLLFGVGIASYIDFNRTQTTKGVGLTLKNNLRGVQSQALTGVKPTTCSTATELESYRIDFFSTSYQAQAVCSGLVSGPVTTYNLESGFQFDPVPTQINFLVLGKGTNTNQLINIKGFGPSGRYYSLCVTRGGDIKDCGYKKGSVPSCTCP